MRIEIESLALGGYGLGRWCLLQPKSPLIPVKVPTSFHTQALAWSPHLVVDTLLLCFLMDSPSISTR